MRETRKYIQPPGRPNRLYFPPDVSVDVVEDPSTVVMITEGEFKTLALWRLAQQCQTTSLPFLPWGWQRYNWRGTIGKSEGPNGERRDQKGVIPEIERIAKRGRRFVIVFDADAEKNPKVRAARWELSGALIERGVEVGYLEWSAKGGQGDR